MDNSSSLHLLEPLNLKDYDSNHKELSDLNAFAYTEEDKKLMTQLYYHNAKTVIKKGASRRALIFWCIVTICKSKNIPFDQIKLMDQLNIIQKNVNSAAKGFSDKLSTSTTALKMNNGSDEGNFIAIPHPILNGLGHNNNNIINNSVHVNGTMNINIGVGDCISALLHKYNIMPGVKTSIMEIYKNCSNEPIFNSSKPDTIAAGLLYYYLKRFLSDFKEEAYFKDSLISETTLKKIDAVILSNPLCS